MALYLAANPNTWVQPEYVDGNDNVGNFWIPRGATVDALWGLPPFWKNGTTFYSSEDIRHTDILGYAYPETQHWTFPSELIAYIVVESVAGCRSSSRFL